jgi:hypothetical protein
VEMVGEWMSGLWVGERTRETAHVEA